MSYIWGTMILFVFGGVIYILFGTPAGNKLLHQISLYLSNKHNEHENTNSNQRYDRNEENTMNEKLATHKNQEIISKQIESLTQKVTSLEAKLNQISAIVSGNNSSSSTQQNVMQSLSNIVEKLSVAINDVNKLKLNQITQLSQGNAMATGGSMPSSRYAYAEKLNIKDGKFCFDVLSDQEVNCLFIITIPSNGNKATFSIIENDFVYKQIISYGSYILDSKVCEFVNNPTTSQPKITTVSPGELENMGNIWYVTKQITLKYV